MSFPFVVPLNDTPQPTPTGGPLSIIERANQTTPYAGGGGGGPSTIGPNPSVSTLTVAPGGEIILNYVSTPSTTAITLNANASGQSANILTNVDNGILPSGSVNGGNPQQTMFLEQTNGTFISDAAFLALRGVNYANYSAGAPGQTTGTIFSAANELRVDGSYPVNFHTPGVSMSSLSVSSINGAAPGGAIPEDLVVNSVAASTFTASTITLQTFDVPVILYGATTLNAGGSTIVGPLDRSYTIPYYQMLTYRGNPGPASTLYASTIDGENFAVFGEPNLTFQYAVFGN